MKKPEQKKTRKEWKQGRDIRRRNGSNHSFQLDPSSQTQKKSIASCDEVNHTNDS